MNNPSSKLTMRQMAAITGMVIGGAMAVLDIQVTNASLGQIQGSLNATFDEISWISTAYLVAEIIVIPVTGFFSQVFGARRYVMVNAILFLFFSALCGFSWNLTSMIVFRALQGLTGAVLIPMTFNVLLRTFPPHRHSIAMAIFSITVISTVSVGPSVGGWLTEIYNWRVIFFINIPLGILLLLLVGWGLEKDKGNLQLLRKMDWLGLLSSAIGLGCLQIILEEGNRENWFESGFIIQLSIISVTALIIFFYTEFTIEKPFINMRLFKNRNFAIGSFVNLCMGLGLYGSVYVMPLFLGEIQHYTSLQIGQVIFWMAAPQLLITPFIPLLLKKIDARLVCSFGALLFGISCLFNSHLSYLFGKDQFFYSQLVRALGQPLMMVPLTTLTVMGIDRMEMGSASGLYNALRNLGGSTGIAMLATVLTRRENFHFSRLSEHVSLLEPSVWNTLNNFTNILNSSGSEPSTAYMQAVAKMNGLTHREALIMSFNDTFLIISIGLFISVIPILFMRGFAKE